MFQIGTNKFDVLVSSLERRARIEEGDQSGEVMAGHWIRDLTGTFYDYNMSIDTNQLSVSDYDRLYELLSSPVAFHEVTFPYGQRMLTFRAYIEEVHDSYFGAVPKGNRWGNLTVTFKAQRPQRRPV